MLSNLNAMNKKAYVGLSNYSIIQFQRTFICLIISYSFLFTQPVLQLNEALKFALEKNYDLVFSEDNTALAANALLGGKGKFLPSLVAGINQNGSLTNNQTRTSISANANWILFDGFQSYQNFRQLKSQSQIANLQYRQSMENLTEAIINSYSELVQEKQHLNSIHELMQVSRERAELTEAKMKVGSGSKLDYWNSMVLLNEDSAGFLTQYNLYQNSKIKFNQLLSRDGNIEFEVIDSIPLNPATNLAEWEKILLENNTELAINRAQVAAAKAAVSGATGMWYPSLNAGLGYSAAPGSWNNSNMAQKGDLTYSINLSIPLFDKLATPTNVKRAHIEEHQQEIRLNQFEQNLKTEFFQFKNQYSINIHQTELALGNLKFAKLQEEGALEKFHAGATSALEFRTSQTQLLDAELRWITAIQNIKQAETALLKLSGLLIKNVPAASEGK